MKLDISGKNLELTPSIKAYVEEKLGGVRKFVTKFDEEGGVGLRVLLGRTTEHHHKGEVYFATVDIRLPKKELRAEDFDSDLHVAIDNVRKKLLAEIETYKGRLGQS